MSSAEQQVQQGTSQRAESSTPGTKKPFVACSLCRTSKAKCITTDPNTGKCDRCVRLNCACVVEPHKRGRKRTRGLDLIPNGESSSHDRINGFTDRGSSSPESAYPEYDAHEEQHRSASGHVYSVSPAHPLAFMSGPNRPFSLDNMLVPSNRTAKRPRYGSLDRGDHSEDVISSGDVPMPMAERLFGFFMTSLNPVILLFDPELHTLGYVRAKSKFLLSTILSSAAKFIAPSVFARLAPIVARYSVTAVFGGHRSVETIQSWMLIYFWKNRSDDRAWTYVGVICRSAVEIGLDRTPTEPAPDSLESDERARRNRIRTWMLAFMMDRAMSSASNKDWCLRGRDPITRNPREFSRHPLRLHGDAVIAGFTELRSIASEAIDVLTGNAALSEPVDTNRQLLSVNYDLDKWGTYWQAETEYYRSPPIFMALLTFFGLHVRLTLNSFAVDLQNRVRTPMPVSLPSAAEQMCHDVAVTNLKQLQHIHALDENILKHSQDSIAIMVAYAAFFLRAITRLSSFSHEQRLGALLLIAETSRLFKSVGENLETSAALQAEFLDQLATQSQDVLPSTLGIPQANGHNGNSTEFDAWLHSLVSPAPANGIMENTDDLFRDPSFQAAPSVLLPHAVANTDLSELSGGQWEEVSWSSSHRSSADGFADLDTMAAVPQRRARRDNPAVPAWPQSLKLWQLRLGMQSTR